MATHANGTSLSAFPDGSDRHKVERWYTASQPWLFPPMYFVERMARVHGCILMEETQFDRKNVSLRLLSGDDLEFRTSPEIGLRHGLKTSFLEAEVYDPVRWVEKLRNTAQMRYGKSAHYKLLHDSWVNLLHAMSKEVALFRHCHLSMAWVKSVLKLDVEIMPGVNFGPRLQDPSEWIVHFGRRTKATDYVQGLTGIQSYLRTELFIEAGIRVWGQSWDAAPNRADLSVLHYLFVYGVEITRQMVQADKGAGNIGTVTRIV